MFKHRLNAEKILDPSGCGSFGACLDYMLDQHTHTHTHTHTKWLPSYTCNQAAE